MFIWIITNIGQSCRGGAHSAGGSKFWSVASGPPVAPPWRRPCKHMKYWKYNFTAAIKTHRETQDAERTSVRTCWPVRMQRNSSYLQCWSSFGSRGLAASLEYPGLVHSETWSSQPPLCIFSVWMRIQFVNFFIYANDLSWWEWWLGHFSNLPGWQCSSSAEHGWCQGYRWRLCSWLCPSQRSACT